MKFKLLPNIVLLSAFLSACSIPNNSKTNDKDTSFNNEQTSSLSTVNSGAESNSNYEEPVEIDYGEFEIMTEDGEYTFNDGVYLISKAGTYDCTGTIKEGYIHIDAGDEDVVTLNLNNVSITSTMNSPIFVSNADEVDIHSDKDFENVIIDKRALKQEDDEQQGNGAIYSKCDLKFTGKGSLEVEANYNNGLHSTKDLKIKNNNLQVRSVNNCLKGNDSIKIESGKLLLISTGGNGIITEDSDVSSKGNQRGNIEISGGEINIYSCKDGIDASYNVNILETSSKDTVTFPSINIYTSNYSSYTENVVTSSEGTYYLKANSQLSSSYRYSILYVDSSGKEGWANASYFTSRNEQNGNRPGPGSYYYYYQFNMPANAQSIQIYCFGSGNENSTSSYIKRSPSYNVNSNYDTIVLNVSNSNLSISSWSTYTANQNLGGMMPGPGQDQGNTNKSSYSAKGIKADNEINIVNGEIFVKAYDDGIHCNYGTSLENGEIGLGDVHISGGNIQIYAADDGVHADRYLNVNGGNIDIINSYEGVEANVINITDGNTLIYATDDGANASNKAGLSPSINVSGGKLDITVASGDTDGIDSNGSFTQTGGIVITRGSGTNMSTGLDCDGSASISGGTFISFGKTESSLKTSGSIKTQVINSTFSAKKYSFTCDQTTIETTNKYSYSNAYIYSDVGNTFSYI